METRVLESYAQWAKSNLENQIEVSLKSLGIYDENNIKQATKKGEYTYIEDDLNSYSGDLYDKRNHIIAIIRRDGYQKTIEESAFTWFNRLVALRFMEVHNFLPHGLRVLSNSKPGVFEPEILKNYSLVQRDLKLDMNLINDFKSQGKIEEIYRHILFKQCNALSKYLPMLFDNEHDYLELLLPNSLLKGETVITKLVEIDESYFLDDVEVIGWLYEFYIKDRKDEINASKDVITKDKLPAVTQFFTTDWIVRYMAENSLGRIWMESYPISSLKSKMCYYVDDIEQDKDVALRLENIKYKNIQPEQIKVLEPCCGSGHILVYLFDLLYEMYEEKGYISRQIPTLILKNNLYGLEIDKRAAQLASFALVMKALKINSRFFNDEYYVTPNILEIYDSRLFDTFDYQEEINELKIVSKKELTNIVKLVETFKYAKSIGSLLVMPKIDICLIENVIDKIRNNAVRTIFNQKLFSPGLDILDHLVLQYKIMNSKYDVMITNPPYVNVRRMDPIMKNYANENYLNSKTDLCAMFMQTHFVKQYGFTAIINLQNWMTGFSYIKFRKEDLSNVTFVSLVHLGMDAFEAIKGEVVQTVSFVIRNYKDFDFKTKFIDLRKLSFNEKKDCFLDKKNKDFFTKKCIDFTAMPSNEYAYYATDNDIKSFKENELLFIISDAKSGVMTGKDELFIRNWYEVNYDDISMENKDFEDKFKTIKWYPVTNGGKTNRWYGNLSVVVNMLNFGQDIKDLGTNTYRLRDKEFYFREACSWSTISSNKLAVRLTPKNVLFGNNGPTLFMKDKHKNHLKYVIGFLNSPVSNYLCTILNPTLSILIDDIEHLPVKFENVDEIETLVNENISLVKDDFDSFETSWDFRKHPLIGNGLIENIFNEYKNYKKSNFDLLRSNEEILNQKFIEIYGLEDQLDYKTEEKNINIHLANYKNDIKSLVSYLVGLIMGRYSLDEEGLILAGGKFNSEKYNLYYPDDDGIIPVYDDLGMQDGLTAKIIDLIKFIYGIDSYKDNIDYIAEALGKKQNESSEETLNRYLFEDFINDHIKNYQKKPIYWMFSSGKIGAFRCLVYMHRYNEDTLARINSKYFLIESARLKHELTETEIQLELLDGKDKLKLEKEKRVLDSKFKEIIEYGQVLDHMANLYIKINLDDGIKINYNKFQDIEIFNENGIKIKKDLLYPLK